MYYKIVAYNAKFVDVYGVEPGKVPLDVVYTAKPVRRTKGNFDGIRTKRGSCIHFAKGPLNLMLWYSYFNFQPIQEPAIYKIQPIGKIEKQKCPDKVGLFQYGANQIQFLGIVNTAEMFDLAVSEFNNDPEEIQRLYPKLNMEQVINKWRLHQQKVYFSM